MRDTDDRRFAWGNDPPTHETTVFGAGHPEDVGTHPAGRGPYGHDDLAGNVWEWMEDEYDPYAYRRATAGEGTPGDVRGDHGGAGRAARASTSRASPAATRSRPSASTRSAAAPTTSTRTACARPIACTIPGKFRIPMLGLRCAKDAAAQ